jgi:hypothetical protein
MNRRILLFALLAVSQTCFARAFEVRLLKGTEKDGVWGTDEFQVSVSSLGVVRHVTVRGKELVWQAAALYTSPVPAGAKEGVRTVQGEGIGDRGLTVTPPTMEAREDRGRRIFAFRHLVANRKVLEGKPLCRVDQQVVITPTGEISIRYDFECIETIPWHGFSLLILFPKEAIAGRDFTLLVGERVVAGRLTPAAPIAESRIREPFDRLSIWSEIGPFHYVWDAPATCEFSPPQLTIQPMAVVYRGKIFKGLRDRVSYRILLPVAQQ